MNKLYFILFSFFVFVASIDAQVETRKNILLSTAKSLDTESRASYSKAIIKAKENRWPLFYKSNNGNRSLKGVDIFGQPLYFTSYADPIQAITVNTNKVWPSANLGFDLTGAADSLTNTLGVWDESAVRTTHYELRNRIQQKDNATKILDHGTHVIGIMMSKGINPLAKGMAYNLKGAYSYDWNNDESEMAAAAANGLLISNHSYGIISGWDYDSDSLRWEFNGRYNENEDYRFGIYNNTAQIYDSIMYNAPNYLIVKAAGNNRTSNGPYKLTNGKWYNNDSTYWRRDQNGKWFNAGIRPENIISNNDSYETLSNDINAKNILVVGAVKGLTSNYVKKEDVVMAGFSSWGPTDDGRIKPDLVAHGVSVFSSTAANDSSYAYLNGTSMATPNAAGSLLLLQELSQQFSPKKFLKATTVKALAIHTTNEAGLYPGPDYQFGWGLLNMYEASIVLKNALVNKNNSTSSDLVYENVLNNGDTATFKIIASGKKPVKATLVWNDVKGVPSTGVLNDPTPKLINDLDLSITRGNSITNSWKLDPADRTSPATRGNNKLDNVEKVEIDTLLVGNEYKIKISHKGLLERSQQAYSLIISGAGGSMYCNSTATSNAGSKIDSISINNIQYINNTTNQYIDNSTLMINGEPTGTLNLFIKTGSVDASNNPRFIKTFIDYNNNGIFEDNELVATSTSITNSTYSANISLPDTLKTGQITKLRVVVMETNNSSNVLACGNYTTGETQDYSLKIVTSSNDLQLSDLINPTTLSCKNNKQYVTVKITNNGNKPQSNLPLSLLIKKGTTVVLNLSETFNGKLLGLESMNYTFQTPFDMGANETYQITASVNVAGDQQKDNNTFSTSIVSANNNNTLAGTATNCNNNLRLVVTNPNSTASYFWYDSSALITPIAKGAQVNTTSSKTNLYLQQGIQSSIGPVYKSSLSTIGGYNNFSGNTVKITALMPITIETTKLYTGNAGKIEFELMVLAPGDSTYYPGLSQFVTLNTGASSPIPTPATGTTATPYVAADSGRTYLLNFKLNTVGNYFIRIKCDDSATIFRNTNIVGNTYPMDIPNVFSITGNSAASNTFYYFFYNTQIRTTECLSNATSIPVVSVPKPTFSMIGDSLKSSAAASYQWYMNDEIITGATNQTLKPIKNAMYKVVTSANNCQVISDNGLILVTDIAEGLAKEIDLKITSNDYIENLIKGTSFFIQFNNIQTQGISLDILNSMGELVSPTRNLINQRTPQKINIQNLITGVYFVKIYANNKVYTKRVFITN